MKSKFTRTINTLKYLPIVATAFLAQELKGQDNTYWSKRVINPFLSPDTTEVAKAYNANNGLSLDAIAARNDIARVREQNSRTHTIKSPSEDIWNCQHWTLLDMVTAYDWGEGVYSGPSADAKLLYNGYKGWDTTLIIANGGTFADQGKLGLPLCRLNFTFDPINGYEHTQTSLLTGNHALVGADWNDIEPRDGVTNVKPGQLNMPLNCNDFTVFYNIIYKNDIHEKILDGYIILKFNIVNGEKILTYNINDDPKYNTFVHLITERENDPPVLSVASSSDPNKIKANATDANLEGIVYSVDGGTAKPLTSGIEIDMGLTPGTHTIKIRAKDYFKLVTDTIFTRIITAPANYAPTITFLTPQNGVKYDKDVRLTGNITDKENDPITASYSLDGNAPITIGKDFDNPLSLENGIHKIIVIASDPTHVGKYSTKDSVIFEMSKITNNAPTILINTPKNGVKYDKDVRLTGNITDKENDPITASYSLDGNAPITIGQVFDAPLSLADGIHKILIYASDPTHAIKDSTTFEFKKATGIDPNPTTLEGKVYPNPVEGNLHIIYDSNLSNNAFMSITTLQGKPVMRKKINGASEEDLDFSTYKSGMYLMKVQDGDRKQVYKIIKR